MKGGSPVLMRSSGKSDIFWEQAGAWRRLHLTHALRTRRTAAFPLVTQKRSRRAARTCSLPWCPTWRCVSSIMRRATRLLPGRMRGGFLSCSMVAALRRPPTPSSPSSSTGSRSLSGLAFFGWHRFAAASFLVCLFLRAFVSSPYTCLCVD